MSDATGQTAPSDGGGQKLWDRDWKLTVQAPNAGTGGLVPTIDLSQLHIQFVVQKGLTLTPWNMQATIYNVGQNMMNNLSKQYSVVSLEAGYKGQRAKIFSGLVWQYQRGRMNATDSFVTIFANSRDLEINNFIVNTTIPANATEKEKIQAASAFIGVQMGYMSDFVAEKAPRGRTLLGMYRDVIRDSARSLGATAHIDDDGKITIL